MARPEDDASKAPQQPPFLGDVGLQADLRAWSDLDSAGRTHEPPLSDPDGVEPGPDGKQSLLAEADGTPQSTVDVDVESAEVGSSTHGRTLATITVASSAVS